MNQGYIFNVQRASFDDGPGIRTVVFMKGCPLICEWCHNPESHNMTPEIMIKKENCVNCKKCLFVCPGGAIGDVASVDRKKCTACGKCTQVCDCDVYKIAGYKADANKIISEVSKDKKLYSKTGGGMTLSGGEPFYQSEFAYELLKSARENEIDTCVETSGVIFDECVKKSLPYIDLLLFDVKIFGEEKSKKYTGAKFSAIKANLMKFADCGINIILRSPIITGVNDDDEHKQNLAALGDEINAKGIEYMPYHRLYTGKYDQLGREYKAF